MCSFLTVWEVAGALNTFVVQGSTVIIYLKLVNFVLWKLYLNKTD